MKKIKVSSEFLKWFALLTMTIDHIDYIYAKVSWLHDTVGRFAFPVFSFLLFQNFITYHPIKKYLIRIGAGALATQMLFYLFHFESKNVFFSFFYALLFISAIEKISQVFKPFCVQIYFVILLLTGLFPFIFRADYGLSGFFFLLALYAYLREKTMINTLAVLLTGIFINFYGVIPIVFTLVILAFLLLGIQVVKGHRFMPWWFFYCYYPLHKVVLYVLSCL